MSGARRADSRDREEPSLKLARQVEGTGQRQPEDAEPMQPSQATSVWFDHFQRHLRWRGQDAQSVREELTSHVKDRARDLMLAGMTEESAIREALNELGDAAGLAHRYRLTRTLPFRRYMMNATIFLGTGAALALSIFAVSSKSVSFQPGSTPVSQPVVAQGGKQPTEVPAGQAEVKPVPQEVRVFPLRYTEAGTIALQLQRDLLARSVPDDVQVNIGGRVVKPTAADTRVSSDARSNSVIISSTPEGMDGIVPWIAKHDIAPRQPVADSAVQPGADAAKIVTSQYTPEPRLPSELGKRMVTGSLKNTPVSEALAFIGQSVNMQVIVHWAELEAQGITRQTPVTVDVKNVSLSMLLDMIEAQAKKEGAGVRLAVRTDKDLIEFATDEFFDRRETTLISYDLSPIQSQVGNDQEIVAIIENFVEPDGWKDNGGTLAELKIGGRKMFVKAPKRFHQQIEWFLKELGASEVMRGR